MYLKLIRVVKNIFVVVRFIVIGGLKRIVFIVKLLIMEIEV